MKKVLVLCGALLGFAHITGAVEPVVEGDPGAAETLVESDVPVLSAFIEGEASAGEQLTAMCAACHGADGNSMAPTFPKIAGLGERYLYKQLKDIRDGARYVPTMEGQLDGRTDQELADMAAYYAAQPISGSQTDPELVALGEKVYRAGVADRRVAACSGCHSPTGQGNAPAGYPALAGQHPEYIAAQLRDYRRGYEDPAGRTNDGDTRIMRSNAFGLSDMEIEAVASYAAGLR